MAINTSEITVSQPARLQFQITGMNCGSCVGRVERALAAVPGVDEANVNLATKTALVRFSGTADPDPVIAALSAAGYPGQLRTSEGFDEADLADHDLKDLTGAFVWAFILGFPVFVLEMGGHMIPAFHRLVMSTIGQTTSWWVQAVLTTMVLAGPGREFYRAGFPAAADAGRAGRQVVLAGRADHRACARFGAGTFSDAYPGAGLLPAQSEKGPPRTLADAQNSAALRCGAWS